jgi:glycine cleavage system H protein
MSRYYTEDHEWIEIDNNVVTIGITSHAADELGEIVFVELPKVGNTLGKGDEFASVESVKTVSGIYAPLDGQIIETNQSVVDTPELMNTSPYESGWLIRVETTQTDYTEDLMDEAAYSSYLETL